MAVAAAVVIAAACAVTGLVRWAGTGETSKPAAAGTQVGAATKAKAAGGSADRRQVTGSPATPGGTPEADLTAVAAGPVNPAVVSALNRARHFPRPATSSAAGRFNVGQAHSPELLRQLSGPPGKSTPSPGKSASPPTGAGTPSPASTGPAAPDQTPSPTPSVTATASTTALIRASAAASTLPQGIDVASFQHPNGAAINWTQVAGAGYQFAAVKATEGNYYTNPYYATDAAEAKSAGLYTTGYHFAIPNVGGGVNQADYAVENGSYAGDGHTLPLELDVEYDPYTSTDHTNECYGLTTSAMVSWISAFDTEVQRLTGQVPAIYSTADWWQTCTGNSKAFSSSQLWIASYSAASPALPAGWPQWTFWQYTSTGTVPGITGNTDVSYFNSSQADPVYPGTQRGAAGSSASLQINSLNAAAGQSLAYTASGLPAGLSISAGGLITGTISAPAGADKVVVTATNPASGATGSTAFLWEVPGTVTVTTPSAQTTTVGSPADLQVQGSDNASGYVPTYTATGLPPGASISSSGLISGWPDAPGTYTVTVTATDALGVSGSATFSWTVGSAAGQGPAGPVRLQNGAKCLDDPAGRTADGTRLEVWACTGGSNQSWTVAPDGTLRMSGKCLAASGSGNGTAVVLKTCDGTGSQRWQLGTNGQLLNPAAGRCLDDPGYRTANGTLLDIWACAGGSNQHWAPAAAAVVSGVAGKCADDPGYRTANGTRLDLWTCAGGTNQRWSVQPDGTIRLAGKCLDVVGRGTASGTQIDLYTCVGASNQKWKLVPEGPVGSEVVNPASGKCLADAGDSAVNGTKLTIQACTVRPGFVWHVL
ncbi:MAG TPA: ricin-type beta-trefoil lectin domain protein [Streptosporangiaceae bacterium]|nr:ricin-type beta-trefoil lectin domain protein [Streptosporangiaceae bacterium]